VTLSTRLSLVLVVTLTLLGGFSLWIAHHSARAYFLEFTQRLNAPIAMYMATNGNLVRNGQLDKAALAELADHVMMINPSVEVYILGVDGHVIAQAASANIIAQPQVRMAPVLEFVRSHREASGFSSDSTVHTDGSITTHRVLLGDNPLVPSRQTAFSAYPLKNGSQVIGYVYAILAGHTHQTLLNAVRSSYSVRNLLQMLAGVVALASAGGTLLFLLLTKRLRRVTQRVTNWRSLVDATGNATIPPITLYRGNTGNSSILETERHPSQHTTNSADEIDELTHAFDAMLEQIRQQILTMADQDRIRRELVASISHDLRTPLTSLQGYLETVLLKHRQYDADIEYRYLSIAHKQGERLHKLVTELFELSRLDATGFSPEFERFSLVELAHDALQDVSVRAERRGIILAVAPNHSSGHNLDAMADIALVQRALENLLDNALRFTPSGGRICIAIRRVIHERIMLSVFDTGLGMSAGVAARAFDPGFSHLCSAMKHPPYERSGTKRAGEAVIGHADCQLADASSTEHTHAGLGLAIVSRIAALHDSHIDLKTAPGKGTRIAFTLAAAITKKEKRPANQAERLQSGSSMRTA
jgi:signal transduction histidine kinase